jgi:NADH dehydrogenase
MAPQQIVILGAGYAGMLATLRLARLARRRPAALTLVSNSATFVERTRLHEHAVRPPDRAHQIGDMLGGSGATFVQGEVVALDLARRTVTAATAGGTRTLAYDRLVYALGSAVDTRVVPGIAAHGFTLAPADIEPLRAALVGAGPRGQVVVCGGGLTGIEAAAELAEAFPQLRVALVTQGHVGATLFSRGQAYVRAALRRLGVELHEQTAVRELTPAGVVTDHGLLPAAVRLWAGPFCVAPLAREAGLAVNAAGQILVDARLHATSHPEVLAVGDAAALAAPAGARLRMAEAVALPMGAHAADNLGAWLAGRPERPFAFSYLFALLSLGRRDGLVQWLRPDDTPRDMIWTGGAAAQLKRLVSAGLVAQLRQEGHWSGVYQMPLAAWRAGAGRPEPAGIPRKGIDGQR